MMAPLFPQRILNISSAVNFNWCQWMWRHWEGESPCVTFSETSATPHSEPEQLKYFLICLHIDILEDDPDFYKNSQHLKLRLVGKGRVWVRGGIPMELEEEEKMGVGGGTMSRAAESSWERRLALQWCRTTHTRPGLGLKLHLGTAWIARTA